MKHTLHSNQRSNRRNSQTDRFGGNGFSPAECQFKPNGPADFGRCYGRPDPSFRRIGDDYFKNEAPAHFLSEAAMFVLVIVTAAVPLVQGIRGALHLLGETGLL